MELYIHSQYLRIQNKNARGLKHKKVYYFLSIIPVWVFDPLWVTASTGSSVLHVLPSHNQASVIMTAKNERTRRSHWLLHNWPGSYTSILLLSYQVKLVIWTHLWWKRPGKRGETYDSIWWSYKNSKKTVVLIWSNLHSLWIIWYSLLFGVKIGNKTENNISGYLLGTG